VVYRALYDSVLRRMPPEGAHTAGFGLIRAAASIPGGTAAMRLALAPRSDPALRVRALGLDFPGPLGLAAGFDKDGAGVLGLAAVGFSFVEVGTVTARPQPGNPKPRMFRFPDERALVNRMGFNNAGAAALATRLRVLRATTPASRVPVIGVNIGKTRAAGEDEAIADYVTSALLVADVADYVVVNVSSPNTPGLRDLQAYDKLHPLLRAVRTALNEASPRRRVPLLVKIAPDLADEDIDAIADLALGMSLDGIIATNTTISRDGLHDAAAVAAAGPGGMSGAPLKARSLEVLKRIRARTGDFLTLISAGGIETPHDARERLDAGATLLQAYTAFIYEGPAWPKRIQQALAGARITPAQIPVIPALQIRLTPSTVSALPPGARPSHQCQPARDRCPGRRHGHGYPPRHIAESSGHLHQVSGQVKSLIFLRVSAKNLAAGDRRTESGSRSELEACPHATRKEF
jgi:dihydroorotate dehydrogenase